MPQIDSRDYLQIGQFQTGRPGSARKPYFVGASLSDWSSGPTTKTILPEQLENRSGQVFFIERVLFAVAGVSDDMATEQFWDTRIRIRPAQHKPWMDELIPIMPLFDPDGVVHAASSDTQNRHTRILTLPEPYPIMPGNTFQVEVECAEFTGEFSDDETRVLFCLVGYTETIPAYTQPRLLPYYKGITQIVSAGDSEALAFQAGEDWHIRSLCVRSTDALPPRSEGFGSNTQMEIQYSVRGRPKIIETPVMIGALQDYHSRAIPLYDMLMRGNETFNIGFRNTSPILDARVFLALGGYRRAS